jgi:exopolysaccharide biosynthesis polyprenyl glycosylphosphotransferase
MGGGRLSWQRRYAVALISIDMVAVIVGATCAYLIRFSPSTVALADTSGNINTAGGDIARHIGYVWFSLGLPILWVSALGLSRAYDEKAFGIGSDEFGRVMHAAIGLTAAIALVSYATKAEVARGYVVLAMPLATALCLFGRYLARRHLHRRRVSGSCMSRVIAVGGATSVNDLVTELHRDPQSGLHVVGVCLPDPADRIANPDAPVLGGFDDVIGAIRRTGADTVAVTSSAEMNPTRLRLLAWQLESVEAKLIVAPGLMEVAGPRLHVRPVTGLPLLHVEEPEFSGARRVVKGVIDRVVATLALIALAPLFLAIVLLIRLTSPGPAFFRQIRTGRNGREFWLIKFRTMTRDAEAQRAALLAANERSEGLLFKIRADPRITPVGRFLRRYSLDELPQLINVIGGSMSLVGPRPPLPSEVALYRDDVKRRLLVKPGLTGLWQVSGRSDLTWEESVRLDLRYVENWSLALDILIIWKTVFAVIRGSGAY